MIRTIRPLQVNEEGEHAWTLSFGDLMSLLLAVFVLIAAMSDLREGERFDSVSRSVRAAFGFTIPEASQDSSRRESLPPLLARFEEMGLTAQKPMLAMDDVSGVAESCSIQQDGDQLVIRLRGEKVFQKNSATLQPTGRRIVDWAAGYLREGALPLEIRGVSGTKSLPFPASYATGRDLAYARARHIADLLATRGIEEDRMIVSSWSAKSTLALRGEKDKAPQVEIIVHAVPTATHENRIAGYSGR